MLARLRTCALLCVASYFIIASEAQAGPKVYVVDTQNVTAAWTHFFEECVGSGHAALALRADYQAQMSRTVADIGFRRVRFHGLFVDDMSVVLPAADGNGVQFSFFNVDRIFDFLLSIGMRPLVEIGFMPSLLASGNQTWSHYDANVTPPNSWLQWANLTRSFVEHLVERYGLDEILTWNFEVWNEPNCCPHDFWTGSQADYFQLFAVTSRAAKSVDPGIRVGGPATAMSAWIEDFMTFCAQNNVSYDFISTHEYPTDPPGPETRTFFRDALMRTRATVGPSMPLYYTEYDDAYNDDTSYSAAFAVFQNYAVNGVVDLLSWWPFSDIFEEGGLYPDPYDIDGLPVDGLVNVYGIPKPSYRAFELMHWTGTQLVNTTPDFFADPTVGVFAVTGNNTSVFVVNWNVKQQPIVAETVNVTVTGLADPSAARAVAYYIDDTHANAYPTWLAMGSPAYLTPKQVAVLNAASELQPEPLALTVSGNVVSFVLTVPANALVNVIISQ
eukprot:TRINITY_DN155_c0_g2_i1.p1 TRINITY_DN155_c0_g2~~TRINITY_DN155_c0_g2_i1.p1  ORF type:complete len:500 (-),score=208.29 TRINITY_DN155_c0_g2_i1:253-1752(-)